MEDEEFSRAQKYGRHRVWRDLLGHGFSLDLVSCLVSSRSKPWLAVEQLLVSGEKEQTTTRTNTGVLRSAQNDKLKNNYVKEHEQLCKEFLRHHTSRR